MNKLPKHIADDLQHWNSIGTNSKNCVSFRDRTKLFSSVRLCFSVQLVIKLIATGAPNKQIANLMNISVKTVEKHRQCALRSTGVNCSACLTHWAIVNGLVVPGEYILF